MARTHGTAWPWLLADNSERIIGLRAPDGYETYLVMQWYGAWMNSTDHTALANTATAIDYDTIGYDGYGITLSNGSRLNVDADGVYACEITAQFSNDTGTIHEADMWLRKNGSDVALTNRAIYVPKQHAGGHGHVVAHVRHVIGMKANDYLELMWSTQSADVILEHKDAQTNPVRPATPSVMVTMQRVA